MWSISEVKAIGKKAFKANYWPSVIVAVLMGIFLGGTTASSNWRMQNKPEEVSITMSGLDSKETVAAVLVFIGIIGTVLAVALLIKIFIGNPITLGGYNFFKQNIEDTPAPLSILGTGFQNYGHNFVTLLLRDLYVFLWTLLLIVPGIIKAYSYSMVPFILAENPDMPANEVLNRSREMMDGNKMQAFLMDLSFIGWILFGIVTLGLGLIFWTSPYLYSSHAALYLKLKGRR